MRAPGPSEAYELYVLGEHAWRSKTHEAVLKAREYFERGIEIDPSYARNYVGAGWTWLGQARYGTGLDWNEARMHVPRRWSTRRCGWTPSSPRRSQPRGCCRHS